MATSLAALILIVSAGTAFALSDPFAEATSFLKTNFATSHENISDAFASNHSYETREGPASKSSIALINTSMLTGLFM